MILAGLFHIGLRDNNYILTNKACVTNWRRKNVADEVSNSTGNVGASLTHTGDLNSGFEEFVCKN